MNMNHSPLMINSVYAPVRGMLNRDALSLDDSPRAGMRGTDSRRPAAPDLLNKVFYMLESTEPGIGG